MASIQNWNVGTQVNDSFSHQKRDVMELINGLLSGQVHLREIPLIRVAWHLGFRTKSGHFFSFCAIWMHDFSFWGGSGGDLFLKWRLFFSMDVNILGCFGYNLCFNTKNSRHDGQFWAIDNRRLFCYKHCCVERILVEVIRWEELQQKREK